MRGIVFLNIMNTLKSTSMKRIMMTRRGIKATFIIIVISIIFIVVACTTVPLTGRKQLSLIPESDMMALSLTEYGKFLKANKISTDKTKTELVRRVGLRISKAVEAYMAQQGLSANLKGYQWEFNLVESPEVNAWCMSGGKVVVYTGLLPVAQNEAGLATVMGHEIAHAVARHGSERMSDQMLVELGGTTLAAALESKPQETQQLAMIAFGAGSQYGVMLPFSRKHEYEADYMGLIFMSMAGYDPNESVIFWQRMAKQGGAKPPEFMSTHPVDENRIAKIKEKLPEALAYYNKAAKK
jgi:predicted Zn-dependent protease